MRTGNKPRTGIFQGRVVRLSGRDPLHGESGPLAIILAVDNQSPSVNAEIALNPDQYRQADMAHLQGKRISIRGQLDQIGRKWLLFDVSDFQVIGE